MDLLSTRRVDPIHQSPRTRAYGFFTKGTVPTSLVLTHLVSFLFLIIFASCHYRQSIARHFACACITPKRFPSVSSQYAKYPTPGIGVFGVINFPPAFFTAATDASTESTPTVFVVVVTSPRFSIPPLIPGAPSAPVFTIQYSIEPSHLLNFHPNTC